MQSCTSWPASLCFRNSPLRHLAVPQNENVAQATFIRQQKGVWNKYNECNKGNSGNWVLELFLEVETPLGARCSINWGLHWRMSSAEWRDIENDILCHLFIKWISYSQCRCCKSIYWNQKKNLIYVMLWK